jgi:hypothetical protein
MKLVGSDDATGLSRYEYTNPIVFEKSSPRPNPKAGAQSQRMAKGLYDTSEGRLYNRGIIDSDYTVDADGNVIAYGNCTGCECDYYYVAENCLEPILQNFSHPTPLALGTVISSSAFDGQCWTIIGTSTSGFPIDFVYESCEQCLGIEVPCDCFNYDITTRERGAAIQYIDCVTQEVVTIDLPINVSTQQCACRDSIILLTGAGTTITELGPCV